MCTVSFIPLGDQIIITSNRDEQHGRAPAAAPAIHESDSGKQLFPRDPQGGGSWFGVHENGNVVVFLNGALNKHESRPPYRISRGLVLLELLGGGDPMESFLAISLQNIEPFTGIIWSGGKLFDCRWDGAAKSIQAMDAAQPHIWSSATLYDERARAKRQQWFTRWLAENAVPTQDDILDFHHFNGYGDHHDGILMNRNGLVYTVSISSVLLSRNTVTFKYLEVQQHRSYLIEMPLSKAIAAKS